MSRLVSRYLAPAFLFLCLSLGGASAAGYLANGALQISAVFVVLLVTLSGALPVLSRRALAPLFLIGVMGALLILQVVPLPPVVWQLLPGRAGVADGFALMGTGMPWLPISLSTDATLAALCSLLPPLAMLLAVYASSGYGRLYAVYVLVVFAAGSIFLGLLQKMQGPDSPYYLYEITNRGGLVGFFANRNHLATLLLATLPFVGALAVSPKRKDRHDNGKIGRLMITGCISLLLAAGIVVVKSTAGWLLLLPVLAATIMVFLRGERGMVPRPLQQVAAVLGAVCLVAVVAAPIKLTDLGDKLSGIDPHMRNQSIRTTARASLDYLPFGAGGGTFTRIYPGYEQVEAASLEYLNHAHNDYVEVFLDFGLPGLALVMAAFAFWSAQGRRLWRSGGGDALARAGFIAIGVVFAHSLVDYPLRTAAIASLVAFSAALLVAPESVEVPAWQSTRKRRKRGSSSRTIEIALAE